MGRVSRILKELKDEEKKRQSSVVDTIFHWCDLVNNSWKRRQRRGSRQFSQRSMLPLNERANSFTEASKVGQGAAAEIGGDSDATTTSDEMKSSSSNNERSLFS